MTLVATARRAAAGNSLAGLEADWPLLATVSGLTVGGLLVGRLWHTRRRPIFPEDIPTQTRKTHEGAIPLVGIVPAAVLLGGLLWIHEFWIAGATLAAATIGFVDDRRKNNEPEDGFWKVKALALALAAGLVTAGLVSECDLSWWEYPLIFGFVFALTNAFNFLDNQNGVLLGLVAVAGLFLGLAGLTAGWLLAAVALAVLPFNWPRGRVFVGDCGAYSLGLVAAALAIGSSPVDSYDPDRCFHALGTVVVPLVDFVQVVAARLWIGVAPWIGDRRHLTHVALHRGVPAAFVGPVFWLLAAGIACASALLELAPVPHVNPF